MDNSKAERFKRVAAPRVQRVLDSLDNLAKCSNRNNYEYTTEEVNKMFRAIKAKVRNMEQRFSDEGGTAKNDSFTF
jgi:hypothetical protein